VLAVPFFEFRLLAGYGAITEEVRSITLHRGGMGSRRSQQGKGQREKTGEPAHAVFLSMKEWVRRLFACRFRDAMRIFFAATARKI
jgi:hypothetical protein